MNKTLGGMAFRPGRPIHVPAPPEQLPAFPIRLSCPGSAALAVDQRVRQGQVLADPNDSGQPGVVCPIDGKITRLDPIDRSPDGARTLAQDSPVEVTIEPQSEHVNTAWNTPPAQGRTLEDWLKSLRQTGVWASRDGYVGLLSQLEAAQVRLPDTLICIGLDSYPPFPVRSSLLMSFPDDTVLGTLAIADLVGAKNVLMTASQNPVVLSKLRPSCKTFQLKLDVRDNAYPCADPTLVAWAHTPKRRRLAVHANPVKEIGVMMIDPWTAIRIARWITLRQIDLARPMMIGWPDRRATMTLAYAMAGQPLSSLEPRLAQSIKSDAAVILGNPMAGKPVTAPAWDPEHSPEPVVPQDELLITVLETVTAPKPLPCIACGWCLDICPTGLNPVRLMESCQSKPTDPSVQQQLRWCIDCGLCSHVCPSELPLAQTLHYTKLDEFARNHSIVGIGDTKTKNA